MSKLEKSARWRTTEKDGAGLTVEQLRLVRSEFLKKNHLKYQKSKGLDFCHSSLREMRETDRQRQMERQ